jgi:PhzF family phenazine biosynthesis protein
MIFKMKLFQVDAFNHKVFSGNPAAVIPLKHWIDVSLMQSIAEENNLSETAFFVPNKNHFELRWFTPVSEIDLCGHATLATAHVLFTELGYNADIIQFQTKSGMLTVRKQENWYTLNFPAEEVTGYHPDIDLSKMLGIPVIKCYKGKWKLLIEIEKEADLKTLKPDFSAMSELEENGVIVTAEGTHVDFVSRFFAPKLGINEDPVTGSAHTLLIPFWAKRLGKDELDAVQVSKRRGILKCKNLGDRVEMTGPAVTYLKGNLILKR